MKSKQYSPQNKVNNWRKQISIFGVMGATCLLFLLITLSLPIQAKPVSLLPLPTRNTPPPSTPTSTLSTKDDDEDDIVPGAYIILHVSNTQTDVWSVVEWADLAGNWHTVEGWQGGLNTGNYKKWWVAQKDFNTGPFRWSLYDGLGGTILASSDSFMLPSVVDSVLTVSVSMPTGN